MVKEETILLQVRIPSGLVRMMDELRRKGLYRSRSEIVMDGIRQIIERYLVRGKEANSLALYLRGKLASDVDFERLPTTPRDESIKIATLMFGVKSVEELMDVLRRRSGR